MLLPVKGLVLMEKKSTPDWPYKTSNRGWGSNGASSIAVGIIPPVEIGVCLLVVVRLHCRIFHTPPYPVACIVAGMIHRDM